MILRLSFVLNQENTLLFRADNFYWTPFFSNQDNGGTDRYIFWSGTVDGNKAFQHFLAPTFMVCYVFIYFCWMSKSINEVGNGKLWPSAGDGAMASQAYSRVDGWGSHRYKGSLITAVFSRALQMRQNFLTLSWPPNVFGTQVSRLPGSIILNNLLVSRGGWDFLATIQICNNKMKTKRN